MFSYGNQGRSVWLVWSAFLKSEFEFRCVANLEVLSNSSVLSWFKGLTEYLKPKDPKWLLPKAFLVVDVSPKASEWFLNLYSSSRSRLAPFTAALTESIDWWRFLNVFAASLIRLDIYELTSPCASALSTFWTFKFNVVLRYKLLWSAISDSFIVYVSLS